MNPEEYAQLFRLGEKHWWFVGTRDILFSTVSRAAHPRKPILDIGCGSGLMMKRLSSVGTLHGVDSDRGALEHCRAMGIANLCQADAGSLPLKSNTFGLAIAADLLEHCDDDSAVLGEIYRVLASRGKVLISVPAYGWLWSTHDDALHHKRRYSRADLAEKAARAGFNIERISFFNTLLFAPAALARLLFGRRRRNTSDYRVSYHENMRFTNRVLLGMLRVENRLLKRVNLPFGLSLLLLASKK